MEKKIQKKKYIFILGSVKHTIKIRGRFSAKLLKNNEMPLALPPHVVYNLS